jgi:hypothetical protein
VCTADWLWAVHLQCTQPKANPNASAVPKLLGPDLCRRHRKMAKSKLQPRKGKNKNAKQAAAAAEKEVVALLAAGAAKRKRDARDMNAGTSPKRRKQGGRRPLARQRGRRDCAHSRGGAKRKRSAAAGDSDDAVVVAAEPTVAELTAALAKADAAVARAEETERAHELSVTQAKHRVASLGPEPLRHIWLELQLGLLESEPELEFTRIGRPIETDEWRAWSAEVERQWQAVIRPFEHAKAALRAAEDELNAARQVLYAAMDHAYDTAACRRSRPC